MKRDDMHDRRAERAVLGSVLLDGIALDVAEQHLDAADFYAPQHGVIWDVMRALRSRGEPIDIVTLAAELSARQRLNTVGGAQYLGELTDEIPTVAHIDSHARVVAGLAVRRRLLDAATAIASLAGEASTPADALAGAHLRLEEVERTLTRGHEGRLFSAALASLLGRDRREASGWPLPWPTLSAALGGLRRGRLVVIAARPAVGKSALALNLALALAAPTAWDPRSIAAPVPVLFFALEMPDEELSGRGAAALARVDARAVESGTLDEHSELPDVLAALRSTRDAPLMIDDRTASVARMRAGAAQFFRQRGPGVIVVDYLQLCDARGLDLERDANRERRVAEMSRAFKLMAKDLGVAVVLLAQLNRSHAEHERPDLRALRESGAVEQDADAVVFLFGPKPAPEELTRDITAYVAKCRGGPGEVEVPLLYRRSHTRFDESPDAAMALPIEEPYRVGGWRAQQAAGDAE